MLAIPSSQDILDAVVRIQEYVHRTPVLINHTISKMAGCELFFKCENFQRIGAFKMRGATNAVLQLTEEEKTKGVTTHSSGNHAQALALAARNASVVARIVMPNTSPQVKQDAVVGYGAEIIFCEPTLSDREATVQKVIGEKGCILIHPYNDYRIIAGQATCAKELLDEIATLDAIMAPVGGGGLLSGTALSAHYFGKNVSVIGAEPENADDAYRSFKSGELQPIDNPNTIADGLRTSLGDKGFGIIKKYVDDILTVSEEEIRQAMRLIWERMKIIVEPSSAVPLAAVLKHKDSFSEQRIGIIISGGNVDVKQLPF